MLETEAREENGARGRSLESMLGKGPLLRDDVINVCTEPKKGKRPL